MDEVVVGWIFIVLMLLWRRGTRCSCCQWILHCFGPYLQWYTLVFAGLLCMLCRTFFDIVKYDYIGAHFLEPSKVREQILRICEGIHANEVECKTLQQQLHIPPWLHTLSIVSPLCGVAAFFGMSFMLIRFIRFSHRHVGKRRNYPWMLPMRMDWVIMILGVPLFFNVLAMRCLVRVWAVMTGSAYKPYMDTIGAWNEMVRLEMATYTMDLELALAVQFYAIWKFGQLCTDFLMNSDYVSGALLYLDLEMNDEGRNVQVKDNKVFCGGTIINDRSIDCCPTSQCAACRRLQKEVTNSAGLIMFKGKDHLTFHCEQCGNGGGDEGAQCDACVKQQKKVEKETSHYKGTLAFTALQGVYAFFFIGIVRTAFDMALAYLQEKPEYKEQVDKIEEKVLAKVGTIFTFCTLLCMVNMVIVSKVKDIKDNLGNANLKFLGTRMLLLIAQIQPQVLSAVTAGSPLYLTVRAHAMKVTIGGFNIGENFHRWTFNQHQAQLAHVSLLNIEGLLIAVVTAMFWRLTDHQKKALMMDDDEKNLLSKFSNNSNTNQSGVKAREFRVGPEDDGYRLLAA